MLSWIFRHRLRLSKIYGPAPALELAGNRFSRSGIADQPAGEAGPGGVWVTRRFVWVRPMPRRSAGTRS